MKLPLDIRPLRPEDLSDLDWSGGAEHLNAVAEALGAAYAGEVALLVVVLPNGRLVGLGGVDLRRDPGAGVLWMLAVHERFQSLGIGRALVRGLEREVTRAGRVTARLTVEHDNPRAIALYRRLGYHEAGSQVETWPVAGHRRYATVCLIMERRLDRSGD